MSQYNIHYTFYVLNEIESCMVEFCENGLELRWLYLGTNAFLRKWISHMTSLNFLNILIIVWINVNTDLQRQNTSSNILNVNEN